MSTSEILVYGCFGGAMGYVTITFVFIIRDLLYIRKRNMKRELEKTKAQLERESRLLR